MPRVPRGYRRSALRPRLVILLRLLLVQSEPHFGSAGQLGNGVRISVCWNPDCPAGRIRTDTSSARKMCCGRVMDRAQYQPSPKAGELGKLVGTTDLNVFICVSCADSVIEADRVDPDRKCPHCKLPRIVKFGTPRES